MRSLQGRRFDNPLFHGALLATLLLGAPGCTDGDLTVTFVDVHVTEAGEITHRRDLTGLAVNAYVPGGAGRDLTGLEGLVSEEGVLTFVDVPEGEVYVRVSGEGSDEIIVTSERELDLGVRLLGRPDARKATVPTPIALDIEGLNPWQGGDELRAFALGAGTYGWLYPTSSDTADPGVTSLEASVDASLLLSPGLIEGERGDRAYLTQLVSHPLGEEPWGYTSIGKVFTPAPFTQVEGETSTWRGSMVDVPQEELHIDWQRSRFAALAAQVHPAAVGAGHWASLYADPDGQRLSESFTPDLLSIFHMTPDDVSFDLTYGNPFPAGWSVVGDVGATFLVEMPVPDAEATVRVRGYVSVARQAEAMGTSTLVPEVAPPTGLQIDGRDAQVELRGVGTSPTVSVVDAGSPGALTYTFMLSRLDVAAAKLETVTVLRSDHPSVSLGIPGLLEEGSWYHLRVTAQTRSAPVVERKAIPWDGAYAMVLSGFFTP
ncbi:hypothetical protein [Chondromyces apiculatus]|uniref:Uncharacterized protein n=1 Tax=Chondromyces apiculatus DSM 436 TaxID=1192034 RepID=A0A017SSX6_9BACT|nr:hypothetical protein [Chondromyces apiculatus]EYF00083.1 Hypothetical protein CAP_1387 [Chondromyces apiculatus DSM 436]